MKKHPKADRAQALAPDRAAVLPSPHGEATSEAAHPREGPRSGPRQAPSRA